MQEALDGQVQFLGGKDLLEKEIATHSSILAGKIPGTEEPGGLQPMGSQRVGHNYQSTYSMTEKTKFYFKAVDTCVRC